VRGRRDDEHREREDQADDKPGHEAVHHEAAEFAPLAAQDSGAVNLFDVCHCPTLLEEFEPAVYFAPPRAPTGGTPSMGGLRAEIPAATGLSYCNPARNCGKGGGCNSQVWGRETTVATPVEESRRAGGVRQADQAGIAGRARRFPDQLRRETVAALMTWWACGIERGRQRRADPCGIFGTAQLRFYRQLSTVN
jgi:hypothetical protein